MLEEHMDCFVLAIGEVTAVPGATHKLNIPVSTAFKTKVNQRPLTGLQKEYFNSVLDKMLEARIVAPIDHKDVKCCRATTLAKKVHEGRGCTIEELQQCINEECIEAGYPNFFKGSAPPNPSQAEMATKEQQNKWQVCQNFAELNKVTKVPPMPQGNIRAKQQWLSRHRWVNMFDFHQENHFCLQVFPGHAKHPRVACDAL
jgi:hypothetical protein